MRDGCGAFGVFAIEYRESVATSRFRRASRAIRHSGEPRRAKQIKENMARIMFEEASGALVNLHKMLGGEQGRETLDALKRFLRKENPWNDVVGAVNPLAAMIALGRYEWVNEKITEKNFGPETLVLGKGARLLHFDSSISSEDAIIEMDKRGFKPATLGDLLEFRAKNHEEPLEYPIIALGSIGVFNDDRFVVYLWGRDSERKLDIYWFDFDGGWDGDCRFLAVRK